MELGRLAATGGIRDLMSRGGGEGMLRAPGEVSAARMGLNHLHAASAASSPYADATGLGGRDFG